MCESRKEETEGNIHLSATVSAGNTLIECELTPVKRKRAEERISLREIKRLSEKYGGFLQVKNEAGTQKIQVAIGKGDA